MADARSKLPARSSFLALASVLAGLPAAAAPSPEWSAAAFALAREQDRPVLALIVDTVPAGAASAWLAGPSIAERLAREFVVVQTDGVLRPDLADGLGLAVRELGGGEGLPLLVALTPDGRPFAGRAGAAALDPAAFAAFADGALAAYRAARSGLDPRANAALEAIRSAQVPSPAQRPLDASAVEGATRAAIGAPELGRADGPLPHAAIALLLAEYQRARRPEVLKLATTALDLRLARPRDASLESGAEESGALATWARAHDVAGRAAYGTEAARLAARLRRHRREDGCFPESSTDGRVITQTNGLAIGALALTGRVAGRAVDVDASRAAAACVLASLGPSGALSRGSVAPAGSAFLDDHAALVAGLLELYDATGEARWRTEAQAVADAALGRFLDVERGGFFLTDAAHDPLPARLRHAFDGATPSANGTMALALLHLSRATAEPRYAALGRGTVDAFLGDLQRAPRALFALAAAAAEIVGPETTSVTESAAPSVVTRGRVTLRVRPLPAPVSLGGTADLEVELDVASGAFVIAHGVRAKDLAGLGVSVPSEGVRAATPRYPAAATMHPTWNAQPLDVYQGRTLLPIRVALARDVPPGPHRLRVRVLFQECDASACRRPDGAVLEVPITVAAR
ncbi:MAG: DUF255 domain-containing protein [Vicinamibacteria bacterium]